MTKGTLSLFAVIALALTTPASAQHAPTGVGVGSDFWTGTMKPELFQLHENGGASVCTGSEVFVTVRGSLGYCMDANENAAGSLQFEDAREVCAAAGKRLPEPAEYKFACQAGIGGLNNMTDDYEWASNTPIWDRFPSSATVVTYGVHVPVLGNASCLGTALGYISRSDLIQSALPFRCVR